MIISRHRKNRIKCQRDKIPYNKVNFKKNAEFKIGKIVGALMGDLGDFYSFLNRFSC